MYCSPIWRTYLIKDITALENIQRRATKFILNDFFSDYKTRLISLHILPLIMQLELNDLHFFLKWLKTLTFPNMSVSLPVPLDHPPIQTQAHSLKNQFHKTLLLQPSPSPLELSSSSLHTVQKCFSFPSNHVPKLIQWQLCIPRVNRRDLFWSAPDSRRRTRF